MQAGVCRPWPVCQGLVLSLSPTLPGCTHRLTSSELPDSGASSPTVELGGCRCRPPHWALHGSGDLKSGSHTCVASFAHCAPPGRQSTLPDRAWLPEGRPQAARQTAQSRGLPSAPPTVTTGHRWAHHRGDSPPPVCPLSGGHRTQCRRGREGSLW